ncbi:aldose 1-epimerase family protein [Galbitalea sp. SE-J8]|uniref:aldose 1-epimerase family protein n=1 Tax=Galbitalea sp. SE-J8 TaxID=3054952 RepID=UPI00259D0F48|nr:aldose 1-epimerase family protein [Galbitalea sp. SE-J8]MDM4763790.1 aldose 1-epimerase family protein [Galbitalea sp. SE-J8]
MASPTGEQYELVHSGATENRAFITQLAAALRTLTVDGQHITEPYGADVPTPSANGIVLVPWPNRVDDGMWILDGRPQHLDITEPRFHNAIHGLLRFTAYTPIERTASSITLAATVFPQHGYPFQLETSVGYRLVDAGLEVTHRITNVGAAAAPVAVGAHPFLRVGDTPIEHLMLTVAARSKFASTQRMIPFVEMPVEATEFDLRRGRPVERLRLDDAYGEVVHEHGIAVHSLAAPDGRAVELWQDESFGYVQVFTPRNYPREGGRGLAVAIEPMTAPPNAFVTKRGVRWVAPGETWTARWGIRCRAAADA